MKYIKKFKEKYCKKCKEKCDKGIVETSKFIRCVDRSITEYKKVERIKLHEILERRFFCGILERTYFYV